MKFITITQGCKVNQYDSDIISQNMIKAGYIMAREGEAPDIIIVNTCTVTENGDKKARRLISKARREFPEGVIVVTGCYPQAFPDEAARNKTADIITGNSQNKNIPALITQYLENRTSIAKISEHEKNFYEPENFYHSDKTRAFIKIEDGCNRFCSYCIIPVARGRIRSRSLENISLETDFHAKDGHKEIVLTGINLSCYGTDIGLSLYDAIKTVSDNSHIKRVRLSSLEPELLTPELIEKLASIDKLCPHFHLSLQSGCSQTLKRMNRNYNPDQYSKIVSELRKFFPECGITTDVMVGFAGETEEEFTASVKFVKNIGFSKIHVFTYSVRPGTAAAKMREQIPGNIKEQRYKKMSQLAAQLQCDFYKKNIGKVFNVLIEKQTSPDYINGFTENYIPVRIYNTIANRHDIITVKITAAKDNYCIAQKL